MRISEFSRRVGKSPLTIRRWEREGRFKGGQRSLGGNRQYTEDDIRKALGIEVKEEDRKVVVYCRVSSNGQKEDLKSQVAAMETFCLSAGIVVDDYISEIGGGMNFNRKLFNGLMERIERGELSKLIIAHQDRLVRFGFDFFNSFAKKHGCKVIVVNQESLSPQAEMVKDLMAIIHCFSCRLYGLRHYKKQIKKAILSEPASA